MVIVLSRNNSLKLPESYVTLNVDESSSKFVASQLNIFGELIPYSVFDPIAVIRLNQLAIQSFSKEIPQKGDVLIIVEKGMPVLAYQVLAMRQLNIRISSIEIPAIESEFITTFVDINENTVNQAISLATEKVRQSSGFTFKPMEVFIEIRDKGDNEFDFEPTNISISLKASGKVYRTIDGISIYGFKSLVGNIRMQGFLKEEDLFSFYLGKLKINVKLLDEDASDVLKVELEGYATMNYRIKDDKGTAVTITINNAQVSELFIRHD